MTGDEMGVWEVRNGRNFKGMGLRTWLSLWVAVLVVVEGVDVAYCEETFVEGVVVGVTRMRNS